MRKYGRPYRGRGHWRRDEEAWRLIFDPPLDVPPDSEGRVMISAPPPDGPEEFAIELEFTVPPRAKSRWLADVWVGALIGLGTVVLYKLFLYKLIG